MSRPSARIAQPVSPQEYAPETRISDEEFERQMAIAAQRSIETGDVPEAPADEELSIEQIQAQLEALRQQQVRADLLAQLAAAKAKQQSVAAVRASVPKHDPDRDSPNTWILVEVTAEETAVSDAWIDAHCSAKKDQRMVADVLPLTQLRKDDSVMALVRGGVKGTFKPLLKAMRTPQGEVLSTARDQEELLSEVKLTAAIHVRDHWSDGAGFGRYGGQLNRATFLEELGKRISPLCPRFLDVVRKEGLPDQLVIRSL
jgi:hypothetical protein